MRTLPAVLTLREASACATLMRGDAQSEPGTQVLVDASALVRFDSSALAVLLDCRRAAMACGKGFAVKGLAPGLLSLAALYGVAELLPAP
jgi:phospholipid transport system transporter-binding protein